MYDRSHLDKLAAAANQKRSEKNYWLNKFSGEFTKSSFPYDINELESPGSKWGSLRYRVADGTFSRLLQLTGNSDVRLYIVLLSAVIVLLNKYSGHKDITVGAPIYKQETEVEFINTVLPLRNRIAGNLTFKELLLYVGQVLFKAVENQSYPMEILLQHLNIPFYPERDFPLFDVVLLLENIHDKKYIQHIKNNITFSFLRTGESIKGKVEYNSFRYRKETVERIVDHFKNLLEEVVHDIDIKVSEIDVISGIEKKEFLFDFNDTAIGYPGEKTIHQLFEEQAARKPDNIALVSSGEKSKTQREQETYTYKELNEEANRLAHILTKKGVVPGSIVGILAQRSCRMIIGILAILKSGGAYLPISPGLPPARKKLMLLDSGARHLLIHRHLRDMNKALPDLFHPGDILYLEDEKKSFAADETAAAEDGLRSPPVKVTPHSPGYVIYTSGSTGRPKGVLLEHRGIVNYIYWAAGRYVKKEKVNFPLYTSFSFDLTVTSIFIPLVTGNTMVIYQEDEDDKEFLIKKVIEENRVNFVKLTPSHLKLILEIMDGSSTFFKVGEKSNIKRFVVGGENLTARLASEIYEKFNGEIEIYNEYGPTETVVGSMMHQYDPAADQEGSVPIGLPIANTHIYLLDESKKSVPLGAAGELFISGAGVGRGYLNRPGLTAEKFLDNPFLPGERMYASGDLARRLGSGRIEFLGRKDQQVKIRGYRVELEEIENKIKNFNKSHVPDTLTSLRPMKEVFKTHQQGKVVRCSRCLLSIDYPGIRFDEQGVCSVCREYETYEEHVKRYFKDEENFVRLLEEIKQNPGRDKGDYDCLLMFSGGKDSSYVLYRLVDMGLKILTFTFDNGYISEAAFANIKKITGELQVEHMVGKAEHMNQVFVESLRSNHNVCQGCWHALNTFAVKIAYEKKIPLVVSGLSRGQIFDMRLEGLYRAGIFAEDDIQEKLLLFRKTFHSKDNKYSLILDTALDEEVVESIGFVDFFRYDSTPVHQVEEYLTAKGWKRPADTGFCSSNCLINDVGIYVYMRERGCHFYAAPLSWDIRMGQLSRDDGLVGMGFKSNMAQVEKILNEIGYYDHVAIKDAVVVDKEDDEGNRYLCAYIVSEKSGLLDIDQLHRFLAGELPDYMIPSYFIQVDEIPLNAIGKVDRRALLEKPGTSLGMNAVYTAPRDKEEKIVAELCREVLKIDKIGIKDNFFTLGATSFNIIRISSKLQEVFKREIPVITLFEYPTIASFMEYMHGENREAVENSSPEDEEWLTSQKRGRNRAREIKKKRKEEEDNEKH